MQRNVIASIDSQQAKEVETNPILLALKDATPAQVDTYIDNNITTLSEARDVGFKTLFKAVSYLLKRVTELVKNQKRIMEHLKLNY